jgi:Xaa-Pro aminopeptidase
VILSRGNNWAWITGGRNERIVYTTEVSFMSLVITKDLKKYCIATNIETKRIEEEDLGDIGYEVLSYPWYEEYRREAIMAEIADGGNFASDVEFGNNIGKLDGDFNELRFSLTENEIRKYKQIGEWCREAIEGTAISIEKGMTEQEVQGIAMGKLGKFGLFPDAIMVGSDERIFSFRHPLTTDKKIDKYAMILTCSSKWGLVVAMTRLVHLGKLPDELNYKMKKVTEIEAKLIANSNPDKSFADITKLMAQSYSKAGYPGMWELHYQGGPIGYNVREYDWFPGKENVQRFYNNQAVAWNPTITGVKSEDTFISRNGNIEFISFNRDTEWPVFEYKINGYEIPRPGILIK